MAMEGWLAELSEAEDHLAWGGGTERPTGRTGEAQPGARGGGALGVRPALQGRPLKGGA